jgi:phosphonate transport system substrate-binding protein
MKSIIAAITLVTVMAMAGCKSNPDNGAPKKLLMAEVSSENLDEIKKVRESIRKFLEKKLGIPVEVIYSTDYDGVIEALKAKKVQVANIPPFAYVIATRTMKLTPLVVLGANGKPSDYRSVIIARGNSNITNMAYVKAHSKELTFCFVDPASTSGHLIPKAYLTSVGLNPDTAFKQTIFAGNHLASVLSVKSGKIDVGCTTSMIFGLMVRKGMIKENDLRVIWTSDPIVAQPIVIRSDVDKAFAKKVQDAYIAMNTEAPEILSSYIKIFMKDTVKRSYMLAQDSFYNGLRKIAGSMKDMRAN